MKKYISEAFGTMMLVVFGCGTAVILSNNGVSDVLTISLAFGLVLTCLCYIIGGISGCHVNPAISFSFYLSNRMEEKEYLFYTLSQFIGGILGALLLVLIFNSNKVLGANTYEVSTSTAFLVEVLLTMFFSLAVLSVTDKEENSQISGLIIGLALTLVHIIGIPFTGTSVNPARSLGVAILTGGKALSQVWLFILAPMVGAAIGAIIYTRLINPDLIKNTKEK